MGYSEMATDSCWTDIPYFVPTPLGAAEARDTSKSIIKLLGMYMRSLLIPLYHCLLALSSLINANLISAVLSWNPHTPEQIEPPGSLPFGV